MRSKVGIIAGEGLLPFILAKRLKDKDNKVFVVAVGNVDKNLSKVADSFLQLNGAYLTEALSFFRKHGVLDVYMLGKVPKYWMYNDKLFDSLMKEIIISSEERDDHLLLGKIVAFFEKEGFVVKDYISVMSDMLARCGVIAGRSPSLAEWLDIVYARKIAKSILPLSFGQTIVVKDKAVVAVEAMEGTDETIKRAGRFCKDGVVLKMMRKDQDLRFDIPVVGLSTLFVLKDSGMSVLALEAGRVLILQKSKFCDIADEYGISVVGVKACR